MSLELGTFGQTEMPVKTERAYIDYVAILKRLRNNPNKMRRCWSSLISARGGDKSRLNDC